MQTITKLEPEDKLRRITQKLFKAILSVFAVIVFICMALQALSYFDKFSFQCYETIVIASGDIQSKFVSDIPCDINYTKNCKNHFITIDGTNYIIDNKTALKAVVGEHIDLTRNQNIAPPYLSIAAFIGFVGWVLSFFVSVFGMFKLFFWAFPEEKDTDTTSKSN